MTRHILMPARDRIALVYRLTFLRDSVEAVLARRRAAAVPASPSDRQLADLGGERAGIDAHLRAICPPSVWCVPSRPAYRPALQGCG